MKESSGEVFGPACVYGQVIKTRRNNRIVKVERRPVIGTEGRFEERLQRSEDSSTLNTSFIERLNLTIPFRARIRLLVFGSSNRIGDTLYLETDEPYSLLCRSASTYFIAA